MCDNLASGQFLAVLIWAPANTSNIGLADKDSNNLSLSDGFALPCFPFGKMNVSRERHIQLSCFLSRGIRYLDDIRWGISTLLIVACRSTPSDSPDTIGCLSVRSTFTARRLPMLLMGILFNLRDREHLSTSFSVPVLCVIS